MNGDPTLGKERLKALLSDGYCLVRLIPEGYGVLGYGGLIDRWPEALIMQLISVGELNNNLGLPPRE